MHRAYAKDGVVCMSVSVDPPERREAALRFLKQQQATFPNLWLDEEVDVWQDKFDINGPPVVFVFDRDGGRPTKFDPNDSDKPATYDDVERFVRQLLGKPQ
jgi:hypothetical protein